MTYGSRGLVGGRERLRECRRPDRRHCREACSADSPVMTRGRSADLEKNLPEPGGTESG